MFLSRVVIDTDNRKKMKEISHASAIHNWVEQSFPDEIKSDIRTRKLWRIDTISNRQYLIIVSENEPNIKKLEEFGEQGTAETKLYDSFLSSLKIGMKARFRIVLNPVISKKVKSNSKRGKVMPHVTVEQQKHFLLERSKKNGFELNDNSFTIVERGYSTLKKKNQKDIHLSKVVYEGILTITNIERFLRTLTKGFGKNKAYGFGLMTIIPER